jgi:hypothetical protein
LPDQLLHSLIIKGGQLGSTECNSHNSWCGFGTQQHGLYALDSLTAVTLQSHPFKFVIFCNASLEPAAINRFGLDLHDSVGCDGTDSNTRVGGCAQMLLLPLLVLLSVGAPASCSTPLEGEHQQHCCCAQLGVHLNLERCLDAAVPLK